MNPTYDPNTTYCVQRHPHGIVVWGPVSVSDLAMLTQAWKRLGYTLMDATVSQHLGAAVVVTDKAGSIKWREELGL